MSTILTRLSPRFDVWEELDPIDTPQVAQGVNDAMQRSIDLALLVASPLILLVDWLQRKQQPEGAEPSWQSLGRVGARDVWAQTWFDSDTFPTGLDLYAPAEEVYALLRLRFSPALPEWEERYFFEEPFPAKEGLYLLSYNLPGEGMTLHWLPADGSDPEDIVQLTSHAWEMEGMPGGALLLEAPTDDQVKRVMIARRW